jgi:hypothetical protein
MHEFNVFGVSLESIHQNSQEIPRVLLNRVANRSTIRKLDRFGYSLRRCLDKAVNSDAGDCDQSLNSLMALELRLSEHTSSTKDDGIVLHDCTIGSKENIDANIFQSTAEKSSQSYAFKSVKDVPLLCWNCVQREFPTTSRVSEALVNCDKSIGRLAVLLAETIIFMVSTITSDKSFASTISVDSKSRCKCLDSCLSNQTEFGESLVNTMSALIILLDHNEKEIVDILLRARKMDGLINSLFMILENNHYEMSRLISPVAVACESYLLDCCGNKEYCLNEKNGLQMFRLLWNRALYPSAFTMSATCRSTEASTCRLGILRLLKHHAFIKNDFFINESRAVIKRALIKIDEMKLNEVNSIASKADHTIVVNFTGILVNILSADAYHRELFLYDRNDDININIISLTRIFHYIWSSKDIGCIDACLRLLVITWTCEQCTRQKVVLEEQRRGIAGFDLFLENALTVLYNFYVQQWLSSQLANVSSEMQPPYDTSNLASTEQSVIEPCCLSLMQVFILASCRVMRIYTVCYCSEQSFEGRKLNHDINFDFASFSPFLSKIHVDILTRAIEQIIQSASLSREDHELASWTRKCLLLSAKQHSTEIPVSQSAAANTSMVDQESILDEAMDRGISWDHHDSQNDAVSPVHELFCQRFAEIADKATRLSLNRVISEQRSAISELEYQLSISNAKVSENSLLIKRQEEMQQSEKHLLEECYRKLAELTQFKNSALPQISSLNAEVATLRTTNSRLQGDLRTNFSFLKATEQEAVTWREQYRMIEEALSRSTRSIDDLKVQLQRERDLNQSFSAENNRLVSESLQLRELLQMEVNRVAELDEKVKTLTEMNSNHAQVIDALRHQLKQRENFIAEKDECLRQLDTTVRERESQIQSLVAENEKYVEVISCINKISSKV